MCTCVLASFVSKEMKHLFIEAVALKSNFDAQVQCFFRYYGFSLDFTQELINTVLFFQLEKMHTFRNQVLQGILKLSLREKSNITTYSCKINL